MTNSEHDDVPVAPDQGDFGASNAPVPEASDASVSEADAQPVDAQPDRLARNSAVQAVGTMTSRLLGFVRTAMLTAMFGLSLANDAFTTANTLPTQLYVLVSDGLLTAVLVPQITKAMLRKEKGKDFVDRLLTLSIIVLAAATAVSIAATPLLINWQMGADKDAATMRLALTLGYLCMPQIFFYGIYSVFGQVLNARGRFAEFAWAPAWANIVQIAGYGAFIALYGYSPDPTTWTPAMVWLLGGSTTLSIVVQGLILIIPLWRTGFRYRPRFGWRGYGFGAVSRMALWSFAAVGVSQIGGMITIWAMNEARGPVDDVAGPAAQQLAYQLFAMPHSIITMSIIVALFPSLARAYQTDDIPGLRRLVAQGIRVPSVLTIPATAGLIALAYPLIRSITFLNERETADLALILAGMAIGLVPFGIATLKHNYCFAREAGRLNFGLMVLQTAIQVGASLLAATVVPRQYAVLTVALGMTAATTIISIVFIGILKKQLNGFPMADTYRLWTRVIIASAIAGVASWFVSGLIAGAGDPRLLQLVALGVGGVLFLAVFWVVARVMHITEVTDAVMGIVGKVLKRRG